MPDLSTRLRSVPWGALAGCVEAILPAVGEVLSGRAAERVLDRLLRNHRGWTAYERAVAAEAVFGVGLWRRRLAFQLGFSAPLEAGPRLLVFSLLRDLAGLPATEARRLSGLDPAVPVPDSRLPTELADRCSLPDWLAATFQRELGGEAESFADSLNVPGPICLRANLALTSVAALAERLRAEGVSTVPGRHATTCLVVQDARPNLLALECFRSGLLEVQDEGSQLLAALVEAGPGDSVLDLCAGAGGKTLALSVALGGEGRLHAFDTDGAKLERLRQRSSRARADNVSVHAGGLPDGLAVDRVLVDAPCSELGALRRGPDLRWRIDPAGFSALPPLQLALLETAVGHLRPGGRLVYATCTLRQEENQDVALELLRRHPDLELARPGGGWLAEDFVRDGFFVCLPHRHGTDGFFGAAFRRRN